MAGNHVIELNDQNFESEVLHANLPVLVDFTATSGLPHEIVHTIVDEIADEYNGQIKVGRLNIDESPEVTGKYSVISVPTVMAFHGGQKTGMEVGLTSRFEMLQLLYIIGNHVIELNDQNFESEVLHANLPVVLVAFIATWAPAAMPCRSLRPVLEQIADEYNGQIKVGRLDIDESPEVTGKYSVQAVPTVIGFTRGQQRGMEVGTSRQELQHLLDVCFSWM